MPNLFLTPASISYLTQFILAQAISLFLIGRLWKQRTRQLGLLTGFFTLATLFIGLMLLDAAFSPYHRLLAVYAENTVLALALVFLIQFAYGFPQPYPQHKWETYAALVASLGYFIWEAGYMIYRYVLLLGPGTVVFRPNLAAYSMALVLALAPVAFVRQSMAADGRSVSWLRKLWKPQGNAARGARAFVLVFGILFVLGLFNVFLIFTLPHTVYNAAMSLGVLTALWLFATNYINFVPGGVSVQAKLSILTLTLFLALLGSVGWLIAPSYIVTFDPDLDRPPNRTLHPEHGWRIRCGGGTFPFRGGAGRDRSGQLFGQRSAITQSSLLSPFSAKSTRIFSSRMRGSSPLANPIGRPTCRPPRPAHRPSSPC